MTERIEIHPYSEDWPTLFEEEKELLQKAIGADVTRIEHIGSTAIPNMLAKPIIDILVESKIFPPSEKIISSLASMGFTRMGDWEPKTGSIRFKKGKPKSRILHMTPINGDEAKKLIRFRDIVRSNPTLVSEYGRCKAEGAAKFGDVPNLYTLHKSKFVDRILGKGS